jgi:hypothetical protein
MIERQDGLSAYAFFSSVFPSLEDVPRRKCVATSSVSGG